MKHVKLFEQFINEKAGVPAGIMPYADDLSERVYAELMKMLKKNGYERSDEVEKKFAFKEILSDKFPVSTVVSNIKYEVVQNLKDMIPKGMPFDGVVAEGAFHGGSALKKKGESFEVHIDVSITFDDEAFDNKKYNDKDYMIEKIKELFYHELLHGYEDVQRYTKRSTNQISDSEAQVYVAGSNAIREGVPVPQPIAFFLYLIYISSAFEVSARTSSIWPAVSKVSDPHEREKIMKNTIPWKAAQDLLSFSVEKLYADVKKDIEKPSLENLIQQMVFGRRSSKQNVDDIMKNIVSSIKQAFEIVNSQIAESTFKKILKKKDFPETEVKNVQAELNRHAADVKKISDDPKVFFKHWERIFHVAGEKAIRKMSKMTTAEI